MLLWTGAHQKSFWGLREEGKFAGVALATDESPLSQPRFRGLRFQRTVMYWGTFLLVEDWGQISPPSHLEEILLGRHHALPRQEGSGCLQGHSRAGMNCFDVVAATGDGGGEHEGHEGNHAYFENLSPSYVRRICLPHIFWRTCGLAIRISGLHYTALAAYLCEGVTWTGLREIATKYPVHGGLGLFRDTSQQCKDLFGNSSLQ